MWLSTNLSDSGASSIEIAEVSVVKCSLFYICLYRNSCQRPRIGCCGRLASSFCGVDIKT